MDRKPVYRCEKCGWKGMLTVAMMPMHPSEQDGPRCPKCFNRLVEANPEGDETRS